MSFAYSFNGGADFLVSADDGCLSVTEAFTVWNSARNGSPWLFYPDGVCVVGGDGHLSSIGYAQFASAGSSPSYQTKAVTFVAQFSESSALSAADFSAVFLSTFIPMVWLYLVGWSIRSVIKMVKAKS